MFVNLETPSKGNSAAAKEGMQVYHMLKHNMSFESMKCTSKLLRDVYGETDFHCSATKAAAIVSGVFTPMIIQQIENELEKAHFISISTDASNHKELKMFPILLRYFLPREGVKIRLIELNKLSGENAQMIIDMLKAAWTKWNIRNKINSYSADNAPLNFGSIERGGSGNVFARMQREFNNNLIGIGCLAHILHNTTKDACLNNIPYDFNHILSLIYKQFNTSTKQTEAIKSFCEEMEIEYKRVKSCVNTRFLAKKTSIISVLRVLGPLFPSKKVPIVLKKKFDDPMHKFYLILVRDLCEMFEDAVLKVEGNLIFGNEALKIVDDLMNKLRELIDASFISIEVEKALSEVNQINMGDEADIAEMFTSVVRPLYRKFIRF